MIEIWNNIINNILFIGVAGSIIASIVVFCFKKVTEGIRAIYSKKGHKASDYLKLKNYKNNEKIVLSFCIIIFIEFVFEGFNKIFTFFFNEEIRTRRQIKHKIKYEKNENEHWIINKGLHEIKNIVIKYEKDGKVYSEKIKQTESGIGNLKFKLDKKYHNFNVVEIKKGFNLFTSPLFYFYESFFNFFSMLSPIKVYFLSIINMLNNRIIFDQKIEISEIKHTKESTGTNIIFKSVNSIGDGYTVDYFLYNKYKIVLINNFVFIYKDKKSILKFIYKTLTININNKKNNNWIEPIFIFDVKNDDVYIYYDTEELILFDLKINIGSSLWNILKSQRYDLFSTN